MKKTITLLLAAAGVAMAEVTPLTLQWQDGYAASPKDTNYVYTDSLYNTVTMVADLNWDALLNAGLTNGTFLFSTNDANGKNHGMGLYVDGGGKHLDAWVNGKDAYLAIDLKYSVIDDLETYTDAALVFTTYDMQSTNSYFEALLYLTADNGETYNLTLEGVTANGYSDGGFDSIASFSFNDEYVDKMDVYNTYLMPGEQLEAIGKLNTPAVPEPTTTTLSLLALAGLAARRRRR